MLLRCAPATVVVNTLLAASRASTHPPCLRMIKYAGTRHQVRSVDLTSQQHSERSTCIWLYTILLHHKPL